MFLMRAAALRLTELHEHIHPMSFTACHRKYVFTVGYSFRAQEQEQFEVLQNISMPT